MQRGIRSSLTFSGENIAVYELEDNILGLSEKESVKEIQVDEKLLKSILWTIRKEKSMFSFNGKELLWDLNTIDELVSAMNEILKPTNNGKTYFLIVKIEDRIAPYSRIYRTSFYLNRNGNILQMVFGEINTNINFGSHYSFQDWGSPNFFKISCIKKKEIFFEGKLESALQFKIDSNCEDKNLSYSKLLETKLENLTNFRWILIDLEKALSRSKEKDNKDDKGNPKSRENRLQELMNLYKRGLINKEDFEIKKAEILREI